MTEIRLHLCLTLAAAALAAGGCGDSDGDDDLPHPAGEGQQASGPGGGSGERGAAGDDRRRARSRPELAGDRAAARAGLEAARGVYDGFAAALAAGVASTDVTARETLDAAARDRHLAAVCDLMSAAARRETVVYVRRSAGLADVDWTCEKAAGLLLRRARDGGDAERIARVEIVGVNARGGRATATVRFGARGPLSTLPLVREDGEWKLGATPAGGT